MHVAAALNADVADSYIKISACLTQLATADNSNLDKYAHFTPKTSDVLVLASFLFVFVFDCFVLLVRLLAAYCFSTFHFLVTFYIRGSLS